VFAAYAGSRTFYNSHAIPSGTPQSSSRDRDSASTVMDKSASKSKFQDNTTESVHAAIASTGDASSASGSAKCNGDVDHNMVDQYIKSASVGSKINHSSSSSNVFVKDASHDELSVNGHRHDLHASTAEAGTQVGKVKDKAVKDNGSSSSKVGGSNALTNGDHNILPQRTNRRSSEKQHTTSAPTVPTDNGLVSLVGSEGQDVLSCSS